QYGLNDRENGGYPAPGANAHVIFLLVFIQDGVELPLGWHHVNTITRLELRVGEGGKHTAFNLLDANAERTIINARADGVRAPYFRPIDAGSQRKILALREREGRLQF